MQQMPMQQAPVQYAQPQAYQQQPNEQNPCYSFSQSFLSCLKNNQNSIDMCQ